MLYYYKIRIDLVKHPDLYEIFEKKYFTKYIRSIEGKMPNVHYHYYAECNVQVKTLRNYISKTFGSGNRVYSVSECEENPLEYIAYIMKEDKNPIIYGVDNEIILQAEKLRDDFVERKSQIRKNKTSFDTLFDVCKDATSDYEIIKKLVNYYIDAGKNINERIIQGYAKCISLKLGFTNKYDFINKLYEDTFRKN